MTLSLRVGPQSQSSSNSSSFSVFPADRSFWLISVAARIEDEFEDEDEDDWGPAPFSSNLRNLRNLWF